MIEIENMIDEQSKGCIELIRCFTAISDERVKYYE